jgi:hypothetical protein
MSVFRNRQPVILTGAMVVLALIGMGSLLVAKSILVFDPIELDRMINLAKQLSQML